ncbi:hypothetical protein [Streptococcus sp. S784/96/1]|uniref:hypothetical protein n=1 Tax=Streptococcus sp. S784/96/1 TaxID=2653499 RepID=UPI001389C363|nr:hypothetical protein [Streptococcus sp. S784/96/1]
MTKIELLDYLHNYLSDGQRHTVRIFGHGGAGKSTFAKELLEILPSDKVNLLETDPYIINGELRQLVSSGSIISVVGKFPAEIMEPF